MTKEKKWKTYFQCGDAGKGVVENAFDQRAAIPLRLPKKELILHGLGHRRSTAAPHTPLSTLEERKAEADWNAPIGALRMRVLLQKIQNLPTNADQFLSERNGEQKHTRKCAVLALRKCR